MWRIRNEEAQDASDIEDLVIATFGAGRFAKTAYRLREGVKPIPELCFVALDSESNSLLGSVQFSNIDIGGTPSLLLGPLAVRPELRGQGIGISLMQKGIEEAKRQGHATVILVGDAPYYSKVGFAQLPPGQIRMPGPVDPKRLLGLSLTPGALENLLGEAKRAQIDIPVSAPATPLS
jgi:predicted N-acetyltransferase YhbS